MSAVFEYEKPFPLGPDPTRYRFLGNDGVSVQKLGDTEFLVIEPQVLTDLARQAMHDVSFYLRASHQESVARILTDDEATDNDRFVARTLLKNSVIAANGQLPGLPGHRDGHRHGQEGPVRAHRRWRREGALQGDLGDLPDRQPALLPGRPAHDVQREEQREQPAGADRHLRQARRQLRVPLPGQGRRLGQQDLPVPADQGAAQRRQAHPLAGREDEDAGDGRLSALPRGLRHRRHLGRGQPQDREAGLGQGARRAPRLRLDGRPRLPGPGTGAATARRRPGRPASGPSSAASTSPTTSG